MPRHRTLSEEDRQRIIRLREKGLTYNQIEALTHLGKWVIRDIAQDVAPLVHRYMGERKEIYLWLVKNWRWKPPEEQRNLHTVYGTRKRRKPSYFRTPYNTQRRY